jgi:DNA adenine methylase
MKTPIKYYGGKQNMVKHILPLIPLHNMYCEPFMGGGAVFFAKGLSPVECINDLNGEVINFYKSMKSNFVELNQKIIETLHSRQSFVDAKVIYDNPNLFDKVTRAWAFWVVTNQGFAGLIGNSWGYSIKENTTSKSIKNKRNDFIAYEQRLNDVQIECTDAIKVIKVRDRIDTFFYIDPPYFNSNCGHYSGYSEKDFNELLELLSQIKGKFLLSSYPSETLTKHTKLNKWNSKQISAKVAVNHGSGKAKIEVLTANFAI